MKFIFIPIFLATTISTAFPQVAKKIVVEHFTNSVCSICASKNPGFYDNLSNQEDILHLAIHPSSPYSSCLLNQNNVEENDARTNFYGIYGGTPRLVIQGAVISPAEDYSDDMLFDPFEGQFSAVSIRFEQIKFNDDSIKSNIIIKTEQANTLGELLLFVALAEDTVFYSSPNGEDQHYDVFRKSLFATEGLVVNIPAEVGDSLIFSTSAVLETNWQNDRIYTLAILQETSSKAVIQAASSAFFADSLIAPTSIGSINESISINIFPNPVFNNNLSIESSDYLENTLLVYDLTGKMCLNTTFENKYLLSLGNYSTGKYLIKVINAKGVFNGNFIKL